LYIFSLGFRALSAASVNILSHLAKSTVTRFWEALGEKNAFYSAIYIEKSTVTSLIPRDGTFDFPDDQWGRGPSARPPDAIHAHR
jgi:hypothetical protein